MDVVRLLTLFLSSLLAMLSVMPPHASTAADGVDVIEAEPLAVPNPDARFKLQIGDEEPIPADPLVPQTPQRQNRRDAITWQLAGQLHLSRAEGSKEELQTAEECFRKAITADPGFIRSYQMLVSLLVSGPIHEERIQEAKRVAFQAAEHSPGGFMLIRQLSTLLARQNMDRGIGVLTESLAIPSLVPRSITYFQIQRDLGLLYKLSGNPNKAAESYKLVFDAVTQTAPRLFNAEQIKEIMADPAALFEEMGQVFLTVKQPQLALEAFNQAADLRGSRSAAHSYNLAQIFRETGKPAESLEELQKYFDAQLQSRGRGAYELLKDVLGDLKRDSELTARLESMREKDPQNSTLRFFLAEQYVEQKRFEEAEKTILNGQMETRDPFGLVGLIPVYRGLQKYEPLLTLLMNAKGLPDPDQPDRLNGLEPELRALIQRFGKEREAVTGDAEAMNGLIALGKLWQQGDEPKIQFVQAWALGELCGKASRVEEAKLFYRQAIELRNEPEFQLYSELGQVLLDADLFDEAIALFKECVDHPSSSMQEQRWRSLYLLSFASEHGGRTDAALVAAADARTAADQAGLGDSLGHVLHAQIGWIHYHAQQLDLAISVYEEVLKKYPKNKQTQETLENAQFSLSAIYVQQGNMEKGEAILQEVLTEDPENAQANNDLGYLWADQGKNLEKAREMIDKALALEPENAAYLDSLGWVLHKLGHTAEAIQKLEQACGKKRGDDPTLHEHLGDCYAKLGRADDAKKTWNKAFELLEKKKSKDQKLRKSLREKLGLSPE